jgi:hypothetical protein
MLCRHTAAVNRQVDRPDQRWWRLAAQARRRPPRPSTSRSGRAGAGLGRGGAQPRPPSARGGAPDARVPVARRRWPTGAPPPSEGSIGPENPGVGSSILPLSTILLQHFRSRPPVAEPRIVAIWCPSSAHFPSIPAHLSARRDVAVAGLAGGRVGLRGDGFRVWRRRDDEQCLDHASVRRWTTNDCLTSCSRPLDIFRSRCESSRSRRPCRGLAALNPTGRDARPARPARDASESHFQPCPGLAELEHETAYVAPEARELIEGIQRPKYRALE